MAIPGETCVSDFDPATKHFKLSEWNSKHPKAKPYPIEWIEDRWRPLAEMLDAIRDEMGEAIEITPNGGYRCAEHNAAMGGAHNSQHMQGRAADIKCPSGAKLLHYTIKKMQKEGRLRRLGGLGNYAHFVHVDIRAKGERGELATWEGKRSAENA